MSGYRAGAFLALAAAWRLVLFVGPQGSDDLAYSELARDLVQGTYSLRPDIFALRLGYVGTIGAIYALFGAGSFSLVAFNLAASIAELALAWKVFRRFLDESAARWAWILLALFPVHVYFATEAHPDVPVALLSTLAVWLFLRAKEENRPALFLAAGLALGAGHWMKESAFFGLAALAVLGGRPRRAYAWTLAGFAALVAVESIFYAAATGDALYRVHAVRHEQREAMIFIQGRESTLRVLFVDVPMMFLNPMGGGFVFFAFLPLAALAGAVLARKDPALRPVLFWTAAVLALLVFWPIQWIPYRPAMRPHPRIFLLLGVPLAILAAHLLARLPKRASWAAAGVMLLASAAASFALQRDGRRFSEGARQAFRQLPAGVAVASDPRTIQLFRLFDGYRESRRWTDWTLPEPAPPYVRVENETWQRKLEEWYGLRPPSWFALPGGTVRWDGTVSRRASLRAILRGEGDAGRDAVRVILVSRSP